MKKIILLLPLIIIIFLTIGFSALERELLVDNIGVVVRPTKIIRVTDAVNSEITNGAQSLSYDYNVDNINGTIKLPQNNSTISYSVTITNIGSQEEGVLDMTLSNNNLDYEINGVKKIERICNTSNVCSGGIFRIYTVKIKYKSGVTATNNNIDFIATFNFKNYYTITYSGFDSVSGLETGILEGDTKTITFNTTTGMPNSVTVIGATGNYTTGVTPAPNETATLVLSNVTGNVTVAAVNGTVEVIEHDDGSTTTITESTVTNNDGTETTTTILVNQDVNGNTTSSSSTTSTTGTQNGVTTTTSTTTNYDANGDTTSSSSTTSTTSTSGGVTTTASTTVNYDENGDTTSSTEATTTASNGTSQTVTTNYDADHKPTTGSTANTDVDGNVNTQEVEYDSNGNPYVSGYTIDTSENENGGGETISGGLNTGVIAFDGRAFTIHLKVNMNPASQSSGTAVFVSAMRKDSNNKYSGFTIDLYNRSQIVTFAGTNTQIKSGSFGSRISGYNGTGQGSSKNVLQYLKTGLQTVTIDATYYPSSLSPQWIYEIKASDLYTTTTSTTRQSENDSKLLSNSSYFPSSLANAVITVGSHGVEHSHDMVSFEVLEFSVQKL